MRSWTRSVLGLLVAGLLSIPAWANTNPPQPGTVNYIEGQVSLDNQFLTSSSVGNTSLQAGQTLTTQSGKAEILLTPGVFLRVGDNSEIRMDSADLANTEVTLEHGRAMLEVDDIHKENNIAINVAGANARVEKKGVYDFDADRGLIRVYDGKAEVQTAERKIKVGESQQLDLRASGKLKSRDFNRDQAKDEFYRWSSLRSSYLAEANIDAARRYRENGPGWYGAGWYWAPWYGAYTWIPGGGLYYSPFGWGYYSPGFIYSAPLFGYGVGGSYYHHFGPGYRPFIPNHVVGGPRPFVGGFRGAPAQGGFHGVWNFRHGVTGGHMGGGHAGGGHGGVGHVGGGHR